MQADVSVRIDAPPDRVWTVMAEVAAWPTWTRSITSATVLDPGPLRVGTRVRIKQPRLPVTVWTVTQLVPGESFTWVATGPGVRTAATHRINPDRAGSAVTLAVVPGGPLGALVGRLTTRLTKRYLAMEAAGLKARAEDPAG